jgi:hypothetical protein
MKKNMTNETHVEGLLYQHALEKKTSGENSKNPGTEYIAGTIDIATDDACTNIVSVHYTYVTATTSKGKTNATFGTLQNIIDGTLATVMNEGKEHAAKVRVDSAIGLNEFYSDRSGKEELVSVKRNEGGFIHTTDALTEDEKSRDTFKCDMIITNTVRVEADEDKGTPEKLIIKGAIFDFRNAILPVEFSALNPKAMDYFEGLGATNKEPVFTKVWGHQVSEVIVKTITEESAFGESSVHEVKNTRKDYVITGAATVPYVWDSEDTILASELVEALSNRETYLATLKKRQEEYNASKGNGSATKPAAAPAKGGFNF